MGTGVLKLSDDFWNIRGSFKIGGVIDIGTQASLVRRRNGKFVFLDSLSLDASVKRKIDKLTNGGADVEAILNLHPFHTLHVKSMHEQFPNANLYGASRHKEKAPDLDWQDLETNDAELHRMFADDFEFSVPRGVDFLSANEKVHFSSVLAYHRASKTIHSDDTIMYLRLPLLMRMFGMKNAVSFHPTLAKALEKRGGAARDFRDWAQKLIRSWGDAENICAAHTATLTKQKAGRFTIRTRLEKALEKVEPTLEAHEQKYG